MTNHVFRKVWYLTVAAVLLLASASFAQTMTMTLTGVGDSATLGNVYVDPYTATVGGSTGVQVICDDWSDNTYLNETWQANVTTLSSVTSSSTTPMFAKSASNPNGTTNPTVLYEELAYLGTQLLANAQNPTSQIELSFAMWELTYPDASNAEVPGPTSYLNTYGTTDEISGPKGVSYWIGQAALNASSTSTAGWTILTPTSAAPTCNGGKCPSSPPQEFLVYNLGNGNGNGDPITNSPESSATVLFGADMLGLLGLVVLFRRRLLRPIA